MESADQRVKGFVYGELLINMSKGYGIVTMEGYLCQHAQQGLGFCSRESGDNHDEVYCSITMNGDLCRHAEHRLANILFMVTPEGYGEGHVCCQAKHRREILASDTLTMTVVVIVTMTVVVIMENKPCQNARHKLGFLCGVTNLVRRARFQSED